MSAPQPDAVATGSLTVTVTDPEGEPLANAMVDVFDGQQTAVVGTAASDQDGMVTFKAVPSTALVTSFIPWAIAGLRLPMSGKQDPPRSRQSSSLHRR